MRYVLSFLLVVLCLVIKAQNDTTSYFVISDIRIEGNKTTKSSIITRELTFEIGDTISVSDIEQELKSSQENIRNSNLFNFVTLSCDTDNLTDNHVIINIEVTERWYFWLYPYLAYADRNINSWYEAGNINRFTYGLEMEYKNFLGLKHSVMLTLISGYNQNYGISYDVPYINNKQHFGLKFGLAYKRDKELAYMTENNKVSYFNLDDEFADQSVCAYITPYYRFAHRNKLFLEFEYNDKIFHDSLAVLNPDFVNAQGSRFQYFSLSAVFKNDYRDDNNYPLNGHYLELMMKKVGLGVFKTSPNFFYAKVTMDWYKHIKGRWYWASNITTRLSDDNDPLYFLNQGLGYKNDFVRTYELYVIDAVNYALMKNNLKFTILNPVTKYISFLSNERFGKIHFALYANVFFDCAYTWNMPDDPSSALNNKFIFGTGIGIDFVTYYDKVFRFEYGINDMGDAGLFIHFVAPI